jgi:hypothetical protein
MKFGSSEQFRREFEKQGEARIVRKPSSNHKNILYGMRCFHAFCSGRQLVESVLTAFVVLYCLTGSWTFPLAVKQHV